MVWIRILAHEGRLPETILTAERGVASNAARNRGFETPGPQPAMTNGRRRAFAPSLAATPETQRVPGPATPRWSAERRRPGCAGRLTPRKRDVAPYERDTLRHCASRRSACPSFWGGTCRCRRATGSARRSGSTERRCGGDEEKAEIKRKGLNTRTHKRAAGTRRAARSEAAERAV